MYLFMNKVPNFHHIFYEMHVITSKKLIRHLYLIRFCHFEQYPHAKSSYSAASNLPHCKVGIFWDLDNKPPKSVSPYDAAIKLKNAVSSYGIVRYMVAYANHHAFSYVPPEIRELRKERKVLNHLENKGIIKPVDPYVCRVCGRKFSVNEKLINHFKIHEREHKKRLNQIAAAKGKNRVSLVGRYAVKMEKYRNAAKEVVVPKVGYGLGGALKRAGFLVKTVSDKPQAADVALRRVMVDMMDRREIECLVLVSDDTDFVGVLKEARERCLKTLVVGDNYDGVLKRNADVCFSWRDILAGRVKMEEGSVVSRLKDRDILYDAEVGKDACNWNNTSDLEDVLNDGVKHGNLIEEDDHPLHSKDDGPWWELDSDSSS